MYYSWNNLVAEEYAVFAVRPFCSKLFTNKENVVQAHPGMPRKKMKENVDSFQTYLTSHIAHGIMKD